jgi:hypothetical protein
VSNPYLEKLRTVAPITRRTRDIVVDGRDEAGARTKAVTDQLGNTVTEHNNSKDQVDVHIRAPHIRVGGRQEEIRQHV